MPKKKLDRPLSRKEVPGLTFVFSLPEPARSMSDFPDAAPCTLWKPSDEIVCNAEGRPLFLPSGCVAKRLVYARGNLTIPFSELKKACFEDAEKRLKWGTVFELRLGLPMGLDDPNFAQSQDLWRVGWVHFDAMDRAQEKRGMRTKFGYYLLAKRVAGTPLILDTAEGSGEDSQFLGADRPLWADRFRRYV